MIFSEQFKKNKRKLRSSFEDNNFHSIISEIITFILLFPKLNISFFHFLETQERSLLTSHFFKMIKKNSF